MAPSAPPSGKLLKLVNDVPFNEPVNVETEAPTRMTSSAALPLVLKTEKWFVPFRTKPIDWPLAVPPPKRAVLGVACAQV